MPHEMRLYSLSEARAILKCGAAVMTDYIEHHGLVFTTMPNGKVYISHKDLYEFVDRFRRLYCDKPQDPWYPAPGEVKYNPENP